MQEALILHVQALHNRYAEGYAELTDTESTPFKEWQATIDATPHEESVSDLFESARNRAIDTDDPAELLAIVEFVNELQSECKQWLRQIYVAQTKRDVPTVSAEELESLYKQIQDAIKSAHNLKASGMEVDPEAVAQSIPHKTRKYKGGVTKTVYDMKRVRIKTRGGRRVGSNNKTTQLIVDGVPVTDTTLGDALRKVGLTWDSFAPMLAEAFPDEKNPWNKAELYSADMLEYNGHKLGLRSVQ